MSPTCSSATSASVDYREAVALQERLRARVQDGELPDVLLLLEHPPVYTRGRRSDPGELPMGEDWYRAQGIDVVKTDRGGKLTYHGPGQLVGYPIMRVDDVVAYVRTMEEAIVAALAEEGIAAGPREGLTGVWVGGPQDRLDRRPRLARRDHPRLRDQRRQRPAAVRVGRAVRARRGADDLDAPRRPAHGRAPRCFRRRMALAFCAAFGRRQRLVTRRAARQAVPVPSAVSDTERIHVTRSRANPGGMDVRKVLGDEVQPFRGRKPPWFKVPPPGGPKYRELTEMIKSEGLHTVCQEAACPNVGECWERGTATFMILGDTCTRRCGFCNVKTGKPTWNDPLEPRASRARSRRWACATRSSRASTATTCPTTAPAPSSA